MLFREVLLGLVLIAVDFDIAEGALDSKTEKTIKYLISKSGQASYSPVEGAQSLSTTNAAILGQLFKISEHFELIPSQIESWRWDEKEQSYRLKLRDDLYFHNGRKANAYDLEFSLLRGFFSQSQSYYQIYVGNILGAEEIKPGTPFASGKVKGLKIVDDHEISVRLKNPNPAFLHSLVAPFLALVPKEEIQDDLINWKKKPIGVGPYKVENEFNGKFTVLKKTNPTKGKINSIELHTVFDPDINYDIASIDFDKSNHPDYVRFYSKYPFATRGMFFDFRSELSKDRNFRRVVDLAIDRESLIKTQHNWQVCHEMLPSITWGRSNHRKIHNIAESKKIYKTINSNLKNKTIYGAAFGSSTIDGEKEKILKKISEDLKVIGLDVKWEPTLDKFMNDGDTSKFVLKYSGMVSEHIDPLLMFGAFRKNSPYVYQKPIGGDPEFDRLYEVASAAIQKEDRIKSLQALSKYLDDQAYFIPLAEEKMVHWFKKGMIQDYGEQNQALILFLDQLKVN